MYAVLIANIVKGNLAKTAIDKSGLYFKDSMSGKRPFCSSRNGLMVKYCVRAAGQQLLVAQTTVFEKNKNYNHSIENNLHEFKGCCVNVFS